MDRQPGYYWVQVIEPIFDGGGVIDEKTCEPEIARWANLRWHRTGLGGEVADQYVVKVLHDESLGLDATLAHQRSNAEATFWYQTTLALVQKLTRWPGINYTEAALKAAEKVLSSPEIPLDPAREAAKVLVDFYHQNMTRLRRQAAELFNSGARPSKPSVEHAAAEPVVRWRGSVTDLVTDLAPLLGPDKLGQLAREAEWKRGRLVEVRTDVVEFEEGQL